MKDFEKWIKIQKLRLGKILVDPNNLAAWTVAATYQELASILEEASQEWGGTHYSKEFLALNIAALKNDHWEQLGVAFRTEAFIHESGNFILAGPYSALRKGIRTSAPTLVIGRTLGKVSTGHLCALAEEIFGKSGEPLNSLLPVDILASCGFAGSESGEAFLVPDGWMFPKSEEGPALNDMQEQRRRLQKSAQKCVEAIFEESSAALLIGAFEASSPWYALQSREFLYHEVGHTTGLGLKKKLSGDWLSTPWYRAVEEWRSDGVEFELLARTLSGSEAGKVVAANLVLRLGVDSQRMGGLERDTDVSASLLTFDRLLQSGFLKIGSNRKLEFACPTYQKLLAATELHRFDALRLTHAENNLTYPEGLWSLYGSINVSGGSRNIFEGLVINPCKGLFSNLN